MEPIKEFIDKVRDKLAYMEFDDFFPQNKKCDTRDIRSVLFYTGIYVVALIFAALFIVLGTAIPVFIAWLLYLIGGVIGIYALVGMVHILMQFMKFGG